MRRRLTLVGVELSGPSLDGSEDLSCRRGLGVLKAGVHSDTRSSGAWESGLGEGGRPDVEDATDRDERLAVRALVADDDRLERGRVGDVPACTSREDVRS